MPIMSMHDVRKDKTYTSEKGLTLEELAKEAGINYPKEPSFKTAEAKKKKTSKKDKTEE